MSGGMDQYRRMADNARGEAAAATLPNVRERHLRSAERFDEIIAGLEQVSLAKSRNEEAKRISAKDKRRRNDKGLIFERIFGD